jgi:hypothetical protein
MTLKEYIELICKAGFYDVFKEILIDVNGYQIPIDMLSKDDVLWKFSATKAEAEYDLCDDPTILHISGLQYDPEWSDYMDYDLVGYNIPYCANYGPNNDDVFNVCVFFDELANCNSPSK